MPPKKSAKKSLENPPKSAAAAKSKKENSTSGSSSSGNSRVRQAKAKANKRVLKEKNDSEESDFEEETVEYRLTPPKSKKKATPPAKKTKKMPPKKDAQQTREKNKQKYMDCIIEAESSEANNNVTNRSTQNIVNLFSGRMYGKVKPVEFADRTKKNVIENISTFKVWRQKTPFDRRITAMTWHPSKPGLACVGSKGGDLVLWNVYQDLFEDSIKTDEFTGRIEGRGPGGSIQSLIFDEISPNRVYIASIDGTVALKDFEGGENDQVFLNTNNWEKWYTGLDVNFPCKTMIAGRNNGSVTLLGLEGEEIWEKRLHMGKCNFVQFSNRQPWMFVTSSVDHVVKIWDMRNIKDKTSALAELEHDKAVNSAYFSSLSGDKLLTTDQHSQIRVYQGPYWNLSRTIHHPHRQFQHLSPIKAVWHPCTDILLAGRYPDPAFPGYREGEPRSRVIYYAYRPSTSPLSRN